MPPLRSVWFAVSFVLLCITAPLVGRAANLSDAEIAQRLITASIANYPGSCPCPYNLARNGSRCGKRSAWSRAGGYAPLCYPEDVTPDMIRQYRLQFGNEIGAALP